MKQHYTPKLKMLSGILVTFSLVLLIISAAAAPLRNIAVSVKQPDGTILKCLASGDEFYHWLHDANGYTIIQHPKTGYYVYAVEENGQLSPSDFVAGKDDPSAKGLKPYASISKKEIQKRRSDYNQYKNQGYDLKDSKGKKPVSRFNTKSATVMNNIVVFIKFAGETPAAEATTYYSDIYNGASSSVNDYYLEVTYDQFTVSSSFYPAPSGGYVVWYTDTQTRNYYQPYNATTNINGYDPNISYTNYTDTKGKTYREHTLLKNAIGAIASSVTGIDMDINGDDYVDCVSFIVSGNNDTWNDLLWPHQWSLWSQDVFMGGKQVGEYTFQQQFFGGSRLDLGTLCHEMFHVIGGPDLYHYDENSTISPAGRWDIMDNTMNVPQHMTGYMKYLYGGWLSTIPEISTSGTYTLSPITTAPTNELKNCYRIPSPTTHLEYFVAEYRKQEGYDTYLPGSGLIVYRINGRLEGIGNADGPPDELYVYRPNGTLTVNGITNSAYFSSSAGRTSINDDTDPGSFLSDGSDGGLKISNVGAAGTSISFDVAIDFTPLVVLKNDNGPGSGVGDGTTTFTVATRFTTSDLVNLVGRHITKIDYFIRQGGGNNVTVMVWEGGSLGNPGTIAYVKNVSTELQYNQWSTHSMTTSVEIEPNKEYWIGYTIVPTGGYPAGLDNGPMIQDKGGWIQASGGAWEQINIYGIDNNFLVRGVVSSTSVDVPTELNDNLIIQNFPNPFKSHTTFRFTLKKQGSVNLNIYNMLGQKVGEVNERDLGSGEHEIPFNGESLTSGVYFYSLQFVEAGSKNPPVTYTRKMTILK